MQQVIVNLSGDSNDLLKQLQTELTKNNEIITKNLNSIDNTISSLDITKHSLGILHLLSTKATTGSWDAETFIHQVLSFIHQCTVRQIRMDPKRFRTICFKLTELCRESKQSIRAVQALRVAINKIGSGEHITPQHWMFVQSCILAKAYKAALPILDRFVFKIDPELTGVESVDTRLYFYYGGICFIGMKDFKKAIEYLEVVISAPATVVSSIMLEAYKKYLLVCLCHKGEVPSLPKYTNSGLQRIFKQMCTGYDEFVTSYQTHSIEDLHKVASNNGETFAKDGNLGLVKQAISALTKQNIQRLTKTFLTLSLQNITEQVALTDVMETENLIFGMIQRGEIFAKINQKDGMVEFLEDPQNYSNPQTLQYLDEQLHATLNISELVQKIHEDISLDQRYVQKLIQSEKAPNRNIQEDEMQIELMKS
uniref:COP9 signalosome complex subunit 3 n=1 Tax=Arcella intermedia TaxID=1963864 RepID=A0A6B2L555_9EUKA